MVMKLHKLHKYVMYLRNNRQLLRATYAVYGGTYGGQVGRF